MPKAQLISISPIALYPTSAGCAMFLGTEDKVFVVYIEPAIGASINACLSNQLPPRPLTHDLFSQVIEGFGGKITRAVITKVDQDVFFARLFIEAENEVLERKILEMDARPSDCIALCVRSHAELYIVEDVWDSLPDRSDLLAQLQEQGLDPGKF